MSLSRARSLVPRRPPRLGRPCSAEICQRSTESAVLSESGGVAVAHATLQASDDVVHQTRAEHTPIGAVVKAVVVWYTISTYSYVILYGAASRPREAFERQVTPEHSLATDSGG